MGSTQRRSPGSVEKGLSTRSNRLDFIDTVRGVGALIVLVNHYFAGYGAPPGLPRSLWTGPAGIVQDGQAAVGMFFLFSGFVLARKYALTGRLRRLSPREWAAFSIARLCRIVIPFAVALWVSALLQTTMSPIGTTEPDGTLWLHTYWHPRPLGELTKQSLLIRYGYDHLLPQDWTLVLETYLSLALPLLVLIATWSTPLLGLVIVVSIVGFRIHGALLPFAMGILVANYADLIFTRVSRLSMLAWWTLLSAALIIYHCRELLPTIILASLREGVIWHLSELGALAVLFALIGSPRSQQWLSRPTFVHLGRTSYSFYLWHFTILQCATPSILLFLNRAGIVGGSAWWIGLTATAVANTTLARLSYRAVEVPSIAAGRYAHSFLTERSYSWGRRGIVTSSGMLQDKTSFEGGTLATQGGEPANVTVVVRATAGSHRAGDAIPP